MTVKDSTSLLRDERERQGLSVRQLARFSDTAASTISRIERGLIEDPRPALQVRIAQALRVPIDRVFPR